MKKPLNKLLAALGLFLLSFFPVHAQTYNWFQGGGTNGTTGAGIAPNEASYFMCTDRFGNTYSANSVSGYGPLYADTFYRSSTYSYANILVTSYNCTGQLRWAKLIGSPNGCELYGITVDSFGHIYLAANYTHISSSHTLYIGSDTSISGSLYNAAGIIQLDTNGGFRWIRFLGQNTSAGFTACSVDIGSLALDKVQNIHFIKLVRGGCQITSSLTSSSYSTYDISYDVNGNFLDAKLLQLDTTLEVRGVALDKPSGKLFAIGYCNGVLSSASEGTRNYIACFDTSRNLIWKDSIYSYDPYSPGFDGIINDEQGNLYTIFNGYNYGVYRGDTIFGIAGGDYLACVMKLDTAGHKKWATTYSDLPGCTMGLRQITFAGKSKIASTGDFCGYVITTHDSILSYAGEGYNVFFTVLDTGGQVHSLQQVHGNAHDDRGNSITADSVGNIYVGGQDADSIWGGGAGYRSVGGPSDFFVFKYGVDCHCTSMPVAVFDTTRSGAGGATVAFNYAGTVSGIDSIRWSFGDGATDTATSPTHTYTALGTYNACVRVYSACGNDRYCTDVVIRCFAAPTSSFTPATGGTGLSATRNFTYTGTTIGLDSVVWAFGDGSQATGTTATHTYTATGTYTVCATAYNPCGSNSVCHTDTVRCITFPAASYTNSGITGTRSFTYTGTTTGLDSVVWHYGDGSRGTGTTSAHTYLATGTFTVCTIAYNPCGIDSSCSTDTITCTTHPTAAFTHSGAPTVAFTYTGTTTGLDSVVWHYGDGGRGTGPTSSHAYSAIASYTVCVIAYNHCGVDSMCSTVSVPCLTPPTASFTNTTITRGSYTDTFNYGGTSIGLDSIVWHYGDGGNGAGFNTAHTFANPGTYTVCVIAYSPCGWDSSCITIIIPCDTPITSFSHTGILPVNFIYTGTSTHLDSVVWVYGDGAHGSGTANSHSYTTTGTYTVCVIAYGSCAIDSTCDTIHVLGTGVQKLALKTIQVYPNPATDELYIKDVAEPVGFRLLNVAGVSLQQGILQKGTNTLSLNNYASGIYLLEITSSDWQRNIVRVVKE